MGIDLVHCVAFLFNYWNHFGFTKPFIAVDRLVVPRRCLFLLLSSLVYCWWLPFLVFLRIFIAGIIIMSFKVQIGRASRAVLLSGYL